MFGNELDRLLFSYHNSIANLDPSREDYEYRKTILEEQMEDIFRHEQIMNEHRQLARNRMAFERGLAKAEQDEKKKMVR
jgi:hypothetical protein